MPGENILDPPQNKDLHLYAIEEARRRLLSAYAPPALVLSDQFRVLDVSGDLRPWLGSPGQQGADANVLGLLAPPVAQQLASAVTHALDTGSPELLTVRAASADDTPAATTLRVTPLRGAIEHVRAVLVTFEAAKPTLTPAPAAHGRTDARRQLAGLQEDLQQARSTLQAVITDVETSNEQLHAASAEYSHRIQALGELTADVDNILRSTDIGTLLLDRALTIRRFTPAAVRHLPLVDSDHGRPIADLAERLGGVEFLADVTRVLDQGVSIERRTATAASAHVLLRLTPYLSHGDTPTGVVVSFVDVSSLAEANARTQKVLDSMPQQVAMIDRTGTVVMVNAAWDRFARENGGTESSRFGVGANYFEVCAEDNLPERSEGHDAREGLRRLMAGEIDRVSLEYPCHSPNERRWFLMHAVRVDGTGGAVISHLDITERKLAELNLRELAAVDPLTGLLNRRALNELLAVEADRARRNASTVSAILIDCDNFKVINDDYGHAVGDFVLSQLARRLSEVLRPSDRLARVGGDEFVLVLPDTRVIEAAIIADRLRHTASHAELHAGEDPIRVTLSMAVTTVDVDMPSIDEILRTAHASLANSKAEGKNRVTLAAGGSHGTGRGGELAHLIRTQALRVFAQPIVRLATGDQMGHEFLTRGPEGPMAQPQELFRRATEDGILCSVDLRCLRSCVKTAAKFAGWRHVNLYPSTLLETPMDEILALFGSRTAARDFCIELSEQQLLGAPSALRDAALQLRQAGVKLSIDDVGFGRTSLEHLVLLEPEVVKIDRRWVAGIGRDRGREQTLRRLITVAQALDALVIAEGIEDPEDVKALVDAGAEFGQGYLFGQPADAA